MFGRSLLQTLMPLGSGIYVPSLRWRQAEYRALLRLDESIKDRIVPLITIPPIDFDFEAGIPKKTVHEHVYPFVARYEKNWGCRPAWVALDQSIEAGSMNGGVHVFDYVLDGLAKQACPASGGVQLTLFSGYAMQDGMHRPVDTAAGR